MDRNFAEALKLVLKHEGGWADHPKDPGGATMKGVTLATYRRYIKTTGTKDDLRKITDLQLWQAYRQHYWDAVKGDDLPDGVDYATFDFAVNSGPSRAAKYLQAAVGVRQDGKIGPQTLAAVKASMAPTVIHDLCDKRVEFLRGLKTWPTFRKGWTSRVSDVRAKALQMSTATVAGIPTAPKFGMGIPISPPTPPSPPTDAPASPSGWLSILLNLFRKGA